MLGKCAQIYPYATACSKKKESERRKKKHTARNTNQHNYDKKHNMKIDR